MSIAGLLQINGKSVVAIAGCGGKTSLAELIAHEHRDKKVLVSTTTKMFPMQAEGIMLCQTLRQCEGHKPQRGIQCFGVLNEHSGKLEALPDSVLSRLISHYDVTLLEADGSKGLPCKGWLDSEPVVPAYCTHTVGIVAISALGKPATETTVHRLPEFLSLTGLREGETITARALEAMICAPQGMFRKSAGRRYLLVNQVEDETAADAARTLLQEIKQKRPGVFTRLIYGSIHQDSWREV